MATTDPPVLGTGKHGLPYPCTGRAVSIRDSAVLTANWIVTEIVSVVDARRCAVRILYAAAAAGTANRMQVRVMTAAEMASNGGPPAVADDVWFPPTLIDATPVATLLTGTKETGATMTTTQPEHAVVVARPGAWTIGDPSDAGTDVVRQKLVFDVTDDLWLYVAVKELGDTDAGQLGTCSIRVNLAL